MSANPYLAPQLPPENRPVALGGAFFAEHALVPLLLAVMMIIVPLPLLLFVAWGLYLLISLQWTDAEHGSRRAAATLLQVGVVSAVLVTAVLAPVKTKDRILDGVVHLPRTQMTLGELQQHIDQLPYGERWRAFGSLELEIPASEKSQTIVLPARHLPLRDFIAAVEAQSALRHRFFSCGNGYTILYGVDCGMGSRLRDPGAR